jgi:hypothetical protein
VIEINLYQPGKVNTTILFPTEWNELLLAELNIISQTILQNFKLPGAAKALVFLKILQNRCRLKNIGKRIDAEDATINGLPLIDFIYDKNNLTKQPYPVLKISKFLPTKFIGPEEDFNTLTCGEFEDAEIFYTQFKQEPSEKPLAHLASILYRPKNTKYCRSHPVKGFVQYNAEKEVPRFMKLAPWQLYTIFLWYAGCREQLPLYFPNAFGGGSSDSNTEPDFLSFTKCIHAGAGPKNGSRNDIRQMLLKEFLMEMELETIKAKELQQQYDAAK